MSSIFYDENNDCPECFGEGRIKIRHWHPTESYGCYTETVQCGVCKGTGVIRPTESTSKREGEG
jgi:hypothetical protein